ncbi:MAG: MTH938/NDUFAF3 family protein [Marinicella sp.]|nr:hypothetical protein [Xanthomonadales bacterium]
MDLSENRTQHPNLIKSATAETCVIRGHTYYQSVIIPYQDEVCTVATKTVAELTLSNVHELCAHQPEIIILGTGAEIQFPDTRLLQPIVEQNIGLEVLNNQAAARTYNVLLAEDRNVVCLMLLGD